MGGAPERARQTWVRPSPNFPALKGSKEAAHHPETAYGRRTQGAGSSENSGKAPLEWKGCPSASDLSWAGGCRQSSFGPHSRLGPRNWALAPRSLSGETHYGARQAPPLTAQASPAIPKYTRGNTGPHEQWGLLVQLESRGGPNPHLERGAPRGQGTQLTHLLGVVLHLQAIPSPPGLPLLEDRRQLQGEPQPQGEQFPPLSRSRLQQAPHLSNGVPRPHSWCWSNPAGVGRGHSPTETPGEAP